MKKLLCLLCLGSLALGATASGDNRNQGGGAPVLVGAHRSAAAAPAVSAAVPQRVITSTQPTQRYISAAPFRQRTYVTTPNAGGNATVRYGMATNPRFGRSYDANARTNVTVNRNRNVAVTNNWRGNQFSGNQYAAFRDYHRQVHDRDWWRQHHNRITFVDGGWYYWDGGYWYPAWGYDPYAYYPYDGPIYGYANLTPDQIVASVQEQLQRDGYYAGPIDGILGPMTRQAIAAFQADHGLAITSTVDEPTLATLGLS
jgi:hypothetical protein